MRCGQSCQAASDRGQEGRFVGFEDGGYREVAECPVIVIVILRTTFKIESSATGMNLSNRDYVDDVPSDSQVALDQVPEFHRLQEDVWMLRARLLRICGGIPGEPPEGNKYGRGYVDTRLAPARS